MTIRILIADDHVLVREGIKQVIRLQPGLEVAGEAASGDEVLRLVREHEYDLLLLDMTMEGLSGIELIRRVKSLRPKLPILILSMHSVAQLAQHALRAGANGYITKGSEPEQIFDAITRVAGGGRYIDPVLSEELAFGSLQEPGEIPHAQLSGREFQILQYVARGKSNKEIAQQLSISEKTVSTYKYRILEKMQMDNTADLVRYAMAHHLVE